MAGRKGRQDTKTETVKNTGRKEKGAQGQKGKQPVWENFVICTSSVLPTWYYATIKKSNGFRVWRPAF